MDTLSRTRSQLRTTGEPTPAPLHVTSISMDGSRISLLLTERGLKRRRVVLVPPGDLSDETLNEKPRHKTSQQGKRLPLVFALDGRGQASNLFALESLVGDISIEESIVTLLACGQTVESALAVSCCEVAQ